MIELRKRPQQREGRKIIRRVEIELFPMPKEVPVFTEDGDEIIDECDYEEVPSPSLADVVKHFEDKGVDFSEVYPEHWAKYHYVIQELRPKFTYTEWEPLEEYDERVRQYKQGLKEYQAWYKENKDEIKATKAAIKAQKDAEKKERSLAAKKRKLERQQEKIRRELEGLEQ